jgi:hypothetical protein
MLKLVLGILAAVAAATLYSLGFAVQALDARESPGEAHLRLALLGGLFRRWRWLSGVGLSMLGWPLQVLALGLAPLVIVQPAMAMGLPVLMVAAERMLGERAGRREHLAVSAIVLGVIGAGLCAPARSTTHADWGTLAAVLIGLALASLLPYLLLRLHRPLASVTMIGAGLAFAWSAVGTKLASDDLAHGFILVAIAWTLSTAGASLLGALSEMSALQARPAILVAPVVFVTQTGVPVALAPLLFDERLASTPLGGVPLVAALALLVAGAVALARSPLLLTLMDSERVSRASGSAASPSDSSQEAIRASPSAEEVEPSALTTKTSPARIRP